MKVHKLTVYVIDFDKLGPDEVKSVIQNTKYPNRCISPQVLRVETADCGKWHDDHPLNSIAAHDAELEKLFSK